MPIYEYKCSSCGHQQEFLQKVSDTPLSVCTSCGKPTFTTMLTAAGFQLKGSGWYATDFKSKGSAPAASSGTGSTTPAADSGGGESKGGSESKGEGSKGEGSKGDGTKASGHACGSGGCGACN